MFWERVDVLFDLVKQAQKEARAYITMHLTRTEKISYIYIHIKEEGLLAEAGDDKDYTIYGDGVLEEESTKQYEEAKAHLERLLKEKAA